MAISGRATLQFCKRGISLSFASFMAESNTNATNGYHHEVEGDHHGRQGNEIVLFNDSNPINGDHQGKQAEGEPEDTDTRPTEGDHEGEAAEGEPNELLKPDRHKHALCLSKTLETYTCSGCKEKGNEIGYKCKDTHSDSCDNFTLHKLCAELPGICEHPFRRRCPLKFRPKTRLRRHCNACKKLLGGYVFESEKRDIRFHPLCMTLPQTLEYKGHTGHQLKLLARDKGRPYTCETCDTRSKSGGWRYRCTQATCRISVDLSCAKTEIYGLPEYDTDSVASNTRCCKSDNRSFLSNKVLWVAKTILTGIIESIGNCILNEIIRNDNDDDDHDNSKS